MEKPAIETPVRILTLASPDAFDTVEADDIEACRRAFGFSPSEFAEQLGWSVRKYQRTLEAAREDRFAERDVALAVRGLVDLLIGSSSEGESNSVTESWTTPIAGPDSRALFGKRVVPDIMSNILDECGEWTAGVTPHLLRLVAGRAVRRKLITYGEAATTLEEAHLASRVWPRTLYGMPLGAMCNATMALSRKTGVRIPLLSTIVVKGSGQPGSGVDGMIRKFVKQQETEDRAKEMLARLKRDRDGLIGELQREVFDFGHWPGVIWALGLQQT